MAVPRKIPLPKAPAASGIPQPSASPAPVPGVKSQAAWLAYHKAAGTKPTGTYAAYVAAHTPKPRTTIPLPGAAAAWQPGDPWDVTKTPGYTPGELTPAAMAAQANLDAANKLAIGDANAAWSTAQADYGAGVAQQGFARDQALTRGAQQAAGSGLLRSGLFAKRQATTETNARMALEALQRQRDTAQAQHTRTVDAQNATYDVSTRDNTRSGAEQAYAAWLTNHPTQVAVSKKVAPPAVKGNAPLPNVSTRSKVKPHGPRKAPTKKPVKRFK